jgi:ubiquinone/menaquinone biosynthesis C-methylase UbiE/chorismate mutase
MDENENPLSKIGQDIKVIDMHIIEAMAARMQAAREVEHIKAVRSDNQPIYRESVENDRITFIREYASSRGINPHFAEAILYAVINESCKIQMIQRENHGTYLHSVNDLTYEELKSNLLMLTSIVASTYDNGYAGSFPATRIYLDFESKVINYTIDLLEDNIADRRFLDIGCATGVTSSLVSDKFSHLVGVDISADMIEIAKNKFSGDSRFEFIAADVEGTDFWDKQESKSYDMVTMTLGTGGDLKNISTVLAQLHRVLKNGGRFVFSFYNTNSIMKGYSKIPWLGSLAGSIDHERGCIDVHHKEQIYSLYAKSYTPEEVDELICGNWVITDSWSCPTISPVVPSSVLENISSYEYFQDLDFKLAPESNLGSYLLVAGRKS